MKKYSKTYPDHSKPSPKDDIRRKPSPAKAAEEETDEGEKGCGCTVYKKCSGCQLRNMSYEDQLKFKMVKVDRLLGRISRPNKIIGMDDPSGYRHKVTVAFDFIKGKAVRGVYRSATGGVTPVKDCQVNHPIANEIAGDVLKTAMKLKIPVWSSYQKSGFLRSVTIRIAAGTGEILCTVTGTGRNFPSKSSFTKLLMAERPDITTLAFAVNTSDKQLTGKLCEVLHGPGYIEDVICGKRFRISPESFAQVNPKQTAVLYKTALDYAALTGKETVIDAYCGVGTMSIMAADKAEKVYGCEIVRSAVNNAVINSMLNGTENTQFICEDCGKFMEEFAESGMKADVVIMDPARAGCSNAFLSALAKISPERIVYVSCEPETQTRDLFFLIKQGYKVKKLTPVDMFPFTDHVESVVLLTKVQ